MSGKRAVFAAFAIEDERQRDFLRGQTLHAKTLRVRRYSGAGAVCQWLEGSRAYSDPSLSRGDRLG